MPWTQVLALSNLNSELSEMSVNHSDPVRKCNVHMNGDDHRIYYGSVLPMNLGRSDIAGRLNPIATYLKSSEKAYF